MDEPSRLVDEGATEFERALLGMARSEQPAPELVARMRAGIGLGATAAPVAASHLIWKVVAVLGAAAVVGAGVAWYASQPESEPPAPVITPAEPEPEPAAAPAPVPDEPPAAVAQPAPPRRRTPATASRAPAASDDLPDEIRRLDRARTAMRAGSPRAALKELDGYAQRHPHGVLQPEATVLRIECLEQSGDRARASSLARQFAAEHPSSPLLERLQRLLR